MTMLVILLAITTILCCCSGQDKIIQKPLRFTNFPLADKLYTAANPGNKNYVTSPIIIQFALYMLYMATNTNSRTRRQIFERGFDMGTIPKLDGYVNSLIRSLTEDDLPIADIDYNYDDETSIPATVLRARLFMAINKRFNVKADYISEVQKFFPNKSSAVMVGDFRKDGQKFVDKINTEISNLTNNMIKNFLPAGSLNGHTLLSLIGAIYFKGEWYPSGDFGQKKAIYTNFTFLVEGGRKRKLNVFSGIVRAPYMENDKFQLIKLPFKGSYEREFGMYIVLPKVKGGKSFPSPLEHSSKITS